MSEPFALDVTTEHSGVTRIDRSHGDWAEYLALYQAGDESVVAAVIVQSPDVMPDLEA